MLIKGLWYDLVSRSSHHLKNGRARGLGKKGLGVSVWFTPTPGLHRENYISISFQIEWDTIVVTVFLSIQHFEQNGIPFGSKSKGKLSPRSYPNQCERKWKYSFCSLCSGEFSFIYLARNLSGGGIIALWG